VPIRLIQLLVITCVALGVSACMTNTQNPVEVEITVSDQRFGLADIQLGANQSSAEPKLLDTYNQQPRCEDRAVGVEGTKQAFNMKICEYKPDAVQLGGAPVVRVVSYFLDTILVRLDIDAQGDSKVFDQSQSGLQARWPDSKQRPLNATNRDETVWASGADELTLSHLTRDKQIEYRLRDMRLVEKFPWLYQ